MAKYDALRNLPKTDPNYRSYVQSLHSRLEELRKLWTQMAASLDVAARVQGSNKARSWAASARPPASPARPPAAAPPPPSRNLLLLLLLPLATSSSSSLSQPPPP